MKKIIISTIAVAIIFIGCDDNTKEEIKTTTNNTINNVAKVTENVTNKAAPVVEQVTAQVKRLDDAKISALATYISSL